jgi:hypothetical protein
MRKVLLLLGVCMMAGLCRAQLKSPEAFLGYALGSRYTPHHKIVSYFNHLASATNGQLKLEQYGETNEGRPLLLAYLSSPENMGKLEEIRLNNLRLTGLQTDQAGSLSAPGIVWLSYNVHGNEPSSSEACMKTTYELLTAPRAKAWLANTVIIIDPCINPDGRDRYVNWFTQVVGKHPNAHPSAREHSEPWPGGRTNHYNFDLNRDWAWQSQVESQQRIKKYLAWMPHIHCDYHEQGYNEPYYFAPAAEPLHEVITPWQRDFQTSIGRNHARYFDANGWLYFTRLRFDLFYPAYGDTYPTYNGAIGMTYEQAGHSRGGLAVVTNSGDTLTLKDRVEHHHTTGMSTVEIASQQSGKMLTEFKRYFDEANKNGIGEYKNYIITSHSYAKLQALTDLLDKNGIDYKYFNRVTAKGYNYATQKDEAVNTEGHNIVIPSRQPRSAMVKVLFEPKSKLSDSATYDITAWSLPFAYGVQAYALREEVATDAKRSATKRSTSFKENSYGYLVPYTSFASARLLANLLKNGVKVRFAETDFVYNKTEYKKGTLIILGKGNEQRMGLLKELLDTYPDGYDTVETGFMDSPVDFGSDRVHLIKAPRVALITGEDVGSNAAGEVWHLFEQQLGYPITLINSGEVGRVDWKNFDVMILADGYYSFLGEKASADIRSWVRQGGKIVAMEGAVSQMASNDWGLKSKKGDDDKKEEGSSYSDLKRYENRERDWLVNSIPGAIYKVEMDASHPLAFGYGNTYYTLKQDGNVYEFMKEGWNVGAIKKDNRVAGFAGTKVKEKLKDGTVIGVQEMGRGSIVYLAENPIFRSFWENGKLLLSNAVFLVGQ